MTYKHLRGGVRMAGMIWVLTSAAIHYFFTVWLRGKSASLRARAEWMRHHSRRVMAVMDIAVECRGTPPAGGMLAANHLSYLDILVLGSLQPMIFLSKSEVRHWLGIGYLTALAGTLFIRRERKSDVARFDDAFAQVIQAGIVLGIFPEGTSTNGESVHRFHSSLFGSAAAAGWPVTPAWIGYAGENISVRDEVCYWGDMTFLPHAMHLVTVGKITATVVYGQPVPPGLDRKQIARHLHAEVCRMAENNRLGKNGAPTQTDIQPGAS